MSYLCTRIHHCGQKFVVHENWNGLSHFLTFASYQSGLPIDRCDRCTEALEPTDMGRYLLTEDAYQSLVSENMKLAGLDPNVAPIETEVDELKLTHGPDTPCVIMGPMGQCDIVPLRRVLDFASNRYDVFDYQESHVCTEDSFAETVREFEALEVYRQPTDM